MASWRFQGAKHHPNQNNSGSFHALSSLTVISQEQPPAVVKRVQLEPRPAVSQAQGLQERTPQLVAARLD
jgi:hypothetical protein